MQMVLMSFRVSNEGLGRVVRGFILWGKGVRDECASVLDVADSVAFASSDRNTSRESPVSRRCKVGMRERKTRAIRAQLTRPDRVRSTLPQHPAQSKPETRV